MQLLERCWACDSEITSMKLWGNCTGFLLNIELADDWRDCGCCSISMRGRISSGEEEVAMPPRLPTVGKPSDCPPATCLSTLWDRHEENLFIQEHLSTGRPTVLFTYVTGKPNINSFRQHSDTNSLLDGFRLCQGQVGYKQRKVSKYNVTKITCILLLCTI